MPSFSLPLPQDARILISRGQAETKMRTRTSGEYTRDPAYLSTLVPFLVECLHVPGPLFKDHVIETIRVDLHCHSSMSDGDHSPAYVAHSVAAVGVVWAALTDHNTLSGQPQFRAVLERRGVSSVVGLEIDARSPAGVLHLLGYGLDQHNEASPRHATHAPRALAHLGTALVRQGSLACPAPLPKPRVGRLAGYRR